MFERSAYLYDAYYHFPDYAAASRNLRTLIQQFNPNAKTLLDVACGTGKHLELLRDHYCVESLDINPDLLEIARKRCPEILFHQGNMVDFSLGRRFDVVTYLFCSISYVKTIENAELAVGCMARHLLDGGILIVEPWISPGKCWAKKMSAEITDEPELKIVRMFAHKV